MSFYTFLILQFAAHLLTDYIFQTNDKAQEKNELGFKSPFLKYHVLIAFLTSWILSFQINFVLVSFVIAVTHGLIDGLKVLLTKNEKANRYAFFIDQIAHLVIIIVTVKIFTEYRSIDPLISFNGHEHLILLSTLFLVCLKPSNIFVKELFRAFKVEFKAEAETDDKKPETKTNDLKNAGKLIGILERVLVLTLIISNQFEAVGFLIAAKSILRFKEMETGKTEYVLIGTMASFGIAVAAGILYTKLIATGIIPIPT
ncbi:MAG: DUF3307 domain-containing protein [Crocinitomicaceae bacterium]|nr:DUF3307 domain-containing protein [Crocinitomicaceae bacterium]